MVKDADALSRKSAPPPETPEAAVTLTWNGVLRGMRRLLPVAVFVIPFGLAFGTAAIAKGFTAIQAVVMSALVFSGAAQFASLDLWGDNIAFLSLAAIAAAVNARHVIMGAALSRWINGLPFTRRLWLMGSMSDPNYADSLTAFRGGERDMGVLFGGGLILWLNWVAGTVIGTVASQIGDISVFGFDVVMVCFFAALLVDQVRQPGALAPVLVAAPLAVVLMTWLPTGWNVVVAALAGGCVAMVRHGD